MSDLKTATSALPSVLVAQQLPTTEAAQYTATAGTTVRLASATLVNTSGSSVNVWLSLVKSGGTSGDANRVVHNTALAAGARLDLGELGWLGPGDFVSAKASAATAVTLVLTGVAFSATTVGAPTGIQDDAIGTTARTFSTGTVAGTCAVGTGSNRYLLGFLMVGNTSWTSYASLTTLSMSCSDGAMTKLVSANFGINGQNTGSIHIFGRANPSNATHTLTGAAAKAGLTTEMLAIASMSLTGVASTNGAVATNPQSAAAVNLSVTSAADNRVVFAHGSGEPLIDYNRRIRFFNGSTTLPASGSGQQHWLTVADALGAASVAATSANSVWSSGVGINLVPA